MSKGNLYLIPVAIADGAVDTIPAQVKTILQELDYFLVENVRTARRFISSLGLGIIIENLTFEMLDKKTTGQQLQKIIQPLKEGKNVGVLSESGCPGVADPGSKAVNWAHANGVKVVPLVGPSSILLALMASGFSGQQFAFHGYLPIDKNKLEHEIRALEAESYKKRQTQIFIEAPYRNNRLLEKLKATCNSATMLCVAKGITSADEFIKTATIKEWQRIKVDLHKVPTVFLLEQNTAA